MMQTKKRFLTQISDKPYKGIAIRSLLKQNKERYHSNDLCGDQPSTTIRQRTTMSPTILQEESQRAFGLQTMKHGQINIGNYVNTSKNMPTNWFPARLISRGTQPRLKSTSLHDNPNLKIKEKRSFSNYQEQKKKILVNFQKTVESFDSDHEKERETQRNNLIQKIRDPRLKTNVESIVTNKLKLKNQINFIHTAKLMPQTTKNKDSSLEYENTKENDNQNDTQIKIQTKRLHSKELYDLSEEEWKIFGDRFPLQFEKKKLLGRGGFSLVWLGEHRSSHKRYAIKQILSKNTHQSHLKEISFGTHFFDGGEIKKQFLSFPGHKNLVKFLAYELKPLDTWIFFELCGESLGNHLYDLKGESHGSERHYRMWHKELYQVFKKDNNELKKLLRELAMTLDLTQDQRIVHSDLKTENILVEMRNQQIHSIKLIDYGSSFPFDDLKQFSMATPEYMCPEILNFILYENKMDHIESLVKFVAKYNKPWVVDIWSLGCVILEILSGVPLWMSLKTIVNNKGKDQIETGLFAVKGRIFDKIIERQIEVVTNIDSHFEKSMFSGIKIDKELKYLVKRMLQLDPEKRISPKEIIQILDRTQTIQIG